MHITIPFLISVLAVSASAARLGWRQVDHSTGSTTTEASTITSTGSTTTTFSTDSTATTYSTTTTISTSPTSTTTTASSPSSSYAPPGSLIGRAMGLDDTGEEYTYRRKSTGVKELFLSRSSLVDLTLGDEITAMYDVLRIYGRKVKQ
ncbi:hypothetical protein ARMGADRAFT_1033484 [Armillaria gallica]|uniref:Uncharacterized protein n=1 Tax=Armillaria gallica TaxID=47427 RepID=A0A2H3D2G7_ARMGA|nr:hypothetical protein ARMGADRAFT_1033484 [Armillaria gallica]